MIRRSSEFRFQVQATTAVLLSCFNEELIASGLCNLTKYLQDEQVVGPNNQIKCLHLGLPTLHAIKRHIPLEIQFLELAEHMNSAVVCFMMETQFISSYFWTAFYIHYNSFIQEML